MQLLTIKDPALRPMATVAIHESLLDGLKVAGTISGNEIDADAADRLDQWADQSPNPTGQKANLARSVAALARVSTLQIETQGSALAGTFWDLAGR